MTTFLLLPMITHPSNGCQVHVLHYISCIFAQRTVHQGALSGIVYMKYLTHKENAIQCKKCKHLAPSPNLKLHTITKEGRC